MGKNSIHIRLVPLQTPAQLCTKSLIKSLRWMISRVKNLSTRCVWRFRRWKFGYPRCKHCWPQSNAWILTEIYTTKQKIKNTGGRWSNFFQHLTIRNVLLCWITKFWLTFISLVKIISLMSGGSSVRGSKHFLIMK